MATNTIHETVLAIVQLPDGLYRGDDLRLFRDDYPDMLESSQ
jgi:hypothetical protein